MQPITLFTIVAIVGVVIFIALYFTGRKKGVATTKQKQAAPPKP